MLIDFDSPSFINFVDVSAEVKLNPIVISSQIMSTHRDFERLSVPMMDLKYLKSICSFVDLEKSMVFVNQAFQTSSLLLLWISRKSMKYAKI